MRLTVFTLGSALVFSALISPVQAGVVSQSVNVGNGTASLTTDLDNTDFSAPLSLFNFTAPAGYLAHLDSVNLSFGTLLSVSGTLTNTASQKQTFHFTEGVDSYVDAGDADASAFAAQQTVLGLFGLGTSGDVTQGFGTSSYTLKSGDSSGYPLTGGGTTYLSAYPAAVITDDATLAEFTGNGTFGLTLNTVTSQSFTGGGGNIRTALDTRAGSVFTVDYDYTLIPVPEPASLMLLGAGFIALAFFRIRKRIG